MQKASRSNSYVIKRNWVRISFVEVEQFYVYGIERNDEADTLFESKTIDFRIPSNQQGIEHFPARSAMPVNTLNQGELSSPNPHKSYGDTMVGQGAHVQLGDLSQDVNVAGGIHFHLHSAEQLTGPLTTAASIVQSLQVISGFLDYVCLVIDNKQNNETVIWQLHARVKALREMNNEMALKSRTMPNSKSKDIDIVSCSYVLLPNIYSPVWCNI